jgi:archaellum biogenesis ATPase FlaH
MMMMMIITATTTATIIIIDSYSKVLFEKVKVFQLLKKVPAFYGNRKFIFAFTTARYLSLTLAR